MVDIRTERKVKTGTNVSRYEPNSIKFKDGAHVVYNRERFVASVGHVGCATAEQTQKLRDFRDTAVVRFPSAPNLISSFYFLCLLVREASKAGEIR